MAWTALCAKKHDESMNPYESTMNPIQKTDESMNPSYLMKIMNPSPFFYKIITDSWIHRFCESDSSWIHTDSWIHRVSWWIMQFKPIASQNLAVEPKASNPLPPMSNVAVEHVLAKKLCKPREFHNASSEFNVSTLKARGAGASRCQCSFARECCINTIGPTFWPSLKLSVWVWKFRPEFDE